MLDSEIQVKTPQFDGPLGLLLLLIQQEEMDVRSLNMTVITQQYLNYLNRMRELNFDIAGDYLYMAATLLFLKSENCLQEKDANAHLLLGEDNPMGITSKAELIRRLEELQRFQTLGQRLWELPKRGNEVFTRPKVDRKVLFNSILTPMDINSLITSMMEYLSRERRKYAVVKRDRLSIKEKLTFLKKYLQMGVPTTLFEILDFDEKEKIQKAREQSAPLMATDEGVAEIDSDQESEGEKAAEQEQNLSDKISQVPAQFRLENTVITFISLLELARLEKIQIFQNENKSNIYIEVISPLDDFNVDLASAYDSQAEEGLENQAEKFAIVVAKANADGPPHGLKD